MKKVYLIISIVVAIAFIAGCSNIQLNSTGNVALKALARTAGYKIAQNNAELAAQALPYAKALLNTDDATKLTDVLWPAAIKLIQEKTGADPLIAAAVGDVLNEINIEVKTPEIKAEYIKVALAAFIEGMEIQSATTTAGGKTK